MTGIISSISEDRRGVYVELDGQTRIKLNEKVEVSRQKKGRSIQQNSLLWSYYTWLIYKGGMRDRGHFSVNALHEDCKAWIKETHKLDYKEDFGTADLGVLEFQDYFNTIDFELMNQFHGIDTSPFWTAYGLFKDWQKYHPEGKFKEYLEGNI